MARHRTREPLCSACARRRLHTFMCSSCKATGGLMKFPGLGGLYYHTATSSTPSRSTLHVCGEPPPPLAEHSGRPMTYTHPGGGGGSHEKYEKHEEDEDWDGYEQEMEAGDDGEGGDTEGDIPTPGSASGGGEEGEGEGQGEEGDGEGEGEGKEGEGGDEQSSDEGEGESDSEGDSELNGDTEEGQDEEQDDDPIWSAIKARIDSHYAIDEKGRLVSKDYLRDEGQERQQEERREGSRIPKKFKPPKVGLIKHHVFDAVYALTAQGLNVALVGPAGTGKTIIGEMLANVRDQFFAPMSVGPATTEHQVFGYLSASGDYVMGKAFRPYTEGGVLLVDELDAGSAAAQTSMNTMTANDFTSFPHETLRKHSDFVLLATLNTYGRGADREYVGRQQLDAATLDRYVFLEVDYDTAIEEDAIIEPYIRAFNPDYKWKRNARKRREQREKYAIDTERTPAETARLLELWFQYVLNVRKAREKLGLRMIVSTRALEQGAKAIIAGLGLEDAARIKFWSALDEDTYVRVTEIAGEPWKIAEKQEEEQEEQQETKEEGEVKTEGFTIIQKKIGEQDVSFRSCNICKALTPMGAERDNHFTYCELWNKK